MPKPKFDADAAFKNIIGATEVDEMNVPTTDNDSVPQGNIRKNSLPSMDAMIVPAKKEETRSKRVNFIIKPSVYSAAQKKCKGMGISLNECINQFLEKWSME